MASDYCRSAPWVYGSHWRLVGECLTLSVRKSIMAPRYSDPESIQRSRHTSLSKSGLWAGVTTCYAELWTSKTVMADTGSLKLYQNRPGPAQGKCCLKNVENFCLTLFWYSPTNQRFSKSPKNCDIIFFECDTVTTYRHDSADISPKSILNISL